MKDDHVKCDNPKCGWEGKSSECVHFTHDPHQTDFCPQCEWPVTADQPDGVE